MSDANPHTVADFNRNTLSDPVVDADTNEFAVSISIAISNFFPVTNTNTDNFTNSNNNILAHR
jgi:hypothetical protein